MGTRLKETKLRFAALVLSSLARRSLPCLCLPPSRFPVRRPPPLQASHPPPPSTGGFFPLSEVKRGMTATAWTVFAGTKPEPMEVEILGVLRGVRGPGHDMILAQLHGAKPEYTGVVAGMSGSPVYIGNKLLGSLSYRIGQFSKDPIAGITPIEHMLEVRDLPIAGPLEQARQRGPSGSCPLSSFVEFHPCLVRSGHARRRTTFQPMETPLVMSGFQPEAIRLWQQKMAGTGLDMVAAGGGGGSSKPGDGAVPWPPLGDVFPAPPSAPSWFAATLKSPPPAPSPTSIPSSFWPAATPSCRPAPFPCP